MEDRLELKASSLRASTLRERERRERERWDFEALLKRYIKGPTLGGYFGKNRGIMGINLWRGRNEWGHLRKNKSLVVIMGRVAIAVWCLGPIIL